MSTVGSQVDLFSDENPVEFTDLASEDEVQLSGDDRFRDAVLHATDWTTETIVSQLTKGNILLKPSFQRRDAWKIPQKSRFIESLILGLPIPQIVLAETQEQRGKFIVLDGKQRLLSILQFWGHGEGANNGYALSGLEIRPELSGKRLSHLQSDSALEADLTALLNQPIRTVVIKGWRSIDFLHVVFLRLNTGSVKLSPQELRQALLPGKFTDWVDDAAVNSAGIKALLGLREPDYRMRDIELLSRYLAFRFFLTAYRGRMKEFLDLAFREFNNDWSAWAPELENALDDFEAAVASLLQVFEGSVGRKPGSSRFNRAVFDFLVFYARDPSIRSAMTQNSEAVRAAFRSVFAEALFKNATEHDTAGVPNTVFRIGQWGEALARALAIDVPIPTVVADGGEQRVAFPGL